MLRFQAAKKEQITLTFFVATAVIVVLLFSGFVSGALWTWRCCQATSGLSRPIFFSVKMATILSLIWLLLLLESGQRFAQCLSMLWNCFCNTNENLIIIGLPLATLSHLFLSNKPVYLLTGNWVHPEHQGPNLWPEEPRQEKRRLSRKKIFKMRFLIRIFASSRRFKPNISIIRSVCLFHWQGYESHFNDSHI